MPFNFPNSPTTGQISTQNGRSYTWAGKVWNLNPASGVDIAVNTIQVLVVGAGGGAGGGYTNIGGGGGGGGGYIDTQFPILYNTNYGITIGAGGLGISYNSFSRTGFGNTTTFGPLVAIGGGGGGSPASVAAYNYTRNGFDGASGGGGMGSYDVSNNWGLGGRTINSTQGNNGGIGGTSGNAYGGGGGGGGAGAIGSNGVSNNTLSSAAGGNGGIGIQSTTPSTPTYYCGGGGGGTVGGTQGVGGSGGGGNGRLGAGSGTSGISNSGGGGGGGASSGSGGNGGSGIIVIRMSSALTPILSAGLTYSIEIYGSLKIVTITAGTGTITFN